MPDLEALFPGRFIKSAEFGEKTPTLTIETVAPEKLDAEALKVSKSKKKTLAVVTFKETDRDWNLNRTNALCLAGMFGRDYGAWAGHKVTLMAEDDSSGLSSSGTCIRVKGSPELDAPLKVTIALPNRRPYERTMIPTGSKAKQQQNAAESAPAPAVAEQAPGDGLHVRCTACGKTATLTAVSVADLPDVPCPECFDTTLVEA